MRSRVSAYPALMNFILGRITMSCMAAGKL
jgi:hypothetical protein